MFFTLTSIGEGATGLALLVSPRVVLLVLLGASQPHAETLAVSRVAGAALAALGLSCWLSRSDQPSRSQTGLLFGMLFYDALAALLLAICGTRWNMVGIGLWPAVVLHCVLGIWCLISLVNCPRPLAVDHF